MYISLVLNAETGKKEYHEILSRFHPFQCRTFAAEIQWERVPCSRVQGSTFASTALALIWRAKRTRLLALGTANQKSTGFNITDSKLSTLNSKL